MTSWGIIEPIFATLNGWNENESQVWNTTITSVSIFGALVGALSAGTGKLNKFGKLRMIISMNIFLMISIASCLISAKMIWLIAIGRFFWGICVGVFSALCPKFISELCPDELKNDFGGIN